MVRFFDDPTFDLVVFVRILRASKQADLISIPLPDHEVPFGVSAVVECIEFVVYVNYQQDEYWKEF